MGRPRKYTRDAVVETAMGMFWRDGYRATSVGDLVRETGLNSASMYKEFGDKDGLFLETLKHYRGHVIAPRYQILRDNPNMAGIEAFLANVLAGAARSEYRGCLMMNHLAQKHAITPEARDEIATFVAELESLVAAALRNAQKTGEIGADKDPALLASYVVFCVHGAVLYGRHDTKKGVVPGLYDLVLGVLRG